SARRGSSCCGAEDVTGNEVEVSRRWHAARQQRAAELTGLEGEETFAGLQRFLATVHRLTSERRLGGFAYLGRKPGGGPPRAERESRRDGPTPALQARSAAPRNQLAAAARAASTAMPPGCRTWSGGCSTWCAGAPPGPPRSPAGGTVAPAG